MQPNYRERAWLLQWQTVSLNELAALSGLTRVELHDLVDYGVLTPANLEQSQWAFATDCMPRVRKACRLRDELKLDTHAMALAFMLLERIEVLEARVSELGAQIPRQPA